MKVLVTGGGGFLGSAICRQLRRRDLEVVAFQRGAADSLPEHGIRVFRGDICDAAELRSAAQGCGAIIHTAGKAGIWGKAGDYQRINVGGSRNVIQACRELGIPILVHTSSPSIVQGGRDIEGGNESLPVNTRFLSPYPATKAQAEQLVLSANDHRLRTTALRPHLIWGPGDPHVLPHLKSAVRRGRLALPGAMKKIDTVFVENAAQAHVNGLLELMAAGRCAGKPYFISNDEPLPQGEVITRLLAAVGVRVEIRPVPAWLARSAGAVCETVWRLAGITSEPPVTRFTADQLSTAHWYDISAAKRDLSYKPGVSMAQGLDILRRANTLRHD